MKESKIKDFKAIEGRAQLRDASRRSELRDQFGRALEIDDLVFMTTTTPFVRWKVVDVQPETNPQAPPGTLRVMIAATAVVYAGKYAPNPELVLAMPHAVTPEEKPNGEGDTTAPGPARTPGGIILSDPDGER